MTSIEFINFANDFTGKNIKLFKPENNLKYASYYPFNGTLTPSTKYGISFGRCIVSGVVSGQNQVRFFYSFLRQRNIRRCG